MASYRTKLRADGTAVTHVQIRKRGFPPLTATFERKSDAPVVPDPLPPIPADSAVETASTPNSWVGSVSAPAPRIDHAAVDLDRVPMEPDPSPLSVAGP